MVVLKKRQGAVASIIVLVMLAAVLFAQAVFAEPTDEIDPITDSSSVTTAVDGSETTTTTKSTKPTTTTEDWALISPTDEWGNTLYPPPPSHEETTTTKKPPTTTTTATTTTVTPTTTKKPATNPPYVYNPAHPEDTFSGSVPLGPRPTFWKTRKGETYPPEVEESFDPDEELTGDMVDFGDLFGGTEPGTIGGRQVNWTIVGIAGALFFAAFVGVIVMLGKGKKA